MSAKHGAWNSPLGAARIAAGAVRLSRTQIDRGSVTWLEGRPNEGGRQAVVRWQAGRGVRDLTPADMNVRSRVHEYGGGEYLFRGGLVYCTNDADQQVYRAGSFGAERLLACDPRSRYADFDLSPDGNWMVAVEERTQSDGDVINRIVALPTRGGECRVVCGAYDFVSFPRFSPDGTRLAFTAWNHPNMPWDGTRLFVLDWGPAGPASGPRGVAGGERESIFQPHFSPAGVLTFASDRSGWWNLYQERDGYVEALGAHRVEFGRPQWVFGMSTYDFIDENQLLCAVTDDGCDALCRLDIRTGQLEPTGLGLTAIDDLHCDGDVACFIGASPRETAAVYRYAIASGDLQKLRASVDFELDAGLISEPEPLAYPSGDESAHAFYYGPRNPEYPATRKGWPPLLVKSHGGPTSAARCALDLETLYWTSRGFAVADVNYGGSTGYGRAYRERLRGRWGEVDVDDCVRVAEFLVEQGLVDRDRTAIRGGSAGGFTTLCALTFRDTFRAGCSRYGIGDLEALAIDTHKFESRYLDGLIGPYPESRELYRARSPIHHTQLLSCPIVFFQGLEDRVVPPSQAEAMVAALEARGVPHAYVAFPDEQHGFRRAESVVACLEGELYFYGYVFGFDAGAAPEGMRIVEPKSG